MLGTSLKLRLPAGAIPPLSTYTERDAWEAAVGAGQFSLADLAASYGDQGDPVTAGTPLALAGGITCQFSEDVQCFDFADNYGGDWDTDYAAQPAAFIYIPAGSVTINFSGAVGAFSLEVASWFADDVFTVTATLSDSTQIQDTVNDPSYEGRAAHIGWAGGAITSLMITSDIPGNILALALFKIRPTALLGGSAALIKRKIDVEVTTSAGSSITTTTDVPDGESFPQMLGGPGQNVNKQFNFPDHPTAVRRTWKINRGASVVTPPGSTWRYGIGVHVDQWDYPFAPPAQYTFVGEALATDVVISNVTTDAQITIDAVSSEVVYSVSSTPTSTVIGRSMAHAVYNVDVAVDAEGSRDTDSGTYTGVPNALVIRPADVLRHIAGVRLGWIVSSRFDASTFNAARAAEAAAGMRLDFTLIKAIHSRALFGTIREQTMSAQFIAADGKYRRYLLTPPFTATIRHTFTEETDILEPISVGLTPPADLFNVIGIRYRPDPWSSDFWGYLEKSDPTSQGTGNPPASGYAATNRWLRDFDLLRDQGAAMAAATAWLNWLKDIVYRVEIVVPPEWIHLEPWDHIGITSPRMPGDWVNQEFIIQDIRKHLGFPGTGNPDRITLIARALPSRVTYLQALVDAVALTEAQVRMINKAITETPGLTETHVRQLQRALSETAGLTEDHTLVLARAIAETPGLTEDQVLEIARQIAETAALTDNLTPQGP
jgi:hypothetical protein